MALNSWTFLALALCAVVLLPALRTGFRATLFFAINLLFAWSYWGWFALPFGLLYCLTGYGLARFVRGRGTLALTASLAVLTAMLLVLGGRAFTPDLNETAGIAVVAGVSFLYFKMVHVIVDTAGATMAPPPLGLYLNYCLNFTTLLMGPIQRYKDFASQWSSQDQPASVGFESQLDAVNRVLRGLVKAFVLAPWLAPFIIRPGLAIESLSAIDLLLQIYTFYIFLYLDFSGYCDIMIGIGALMGIRPPENFRFPFIARNVSDYWLRVHRSLTLWLTDYIFTPSYRFALRTQLSRYPFLAVAASLMLTMLAAGVWHGTQMHFVLFGLVHGMALVAVRGYEAMMIEWRGKAAFRRFSDGRLVTAIAVLLTFNFTSLAYMLFALSVEDTFRMVRRLTHAVAWGAG